MGLPISKNPPGRRAEGVLELVACGGYRHVHATERSHLTPLTGPRASFHKVLPSPLEVGTEETQRPLPAGRLVPKIRRSVIRTRARFLPWGSYVF